MTRRSALAFLLLALLAVLSLGPARPVRAATLEIFEKVDGSFVGGPDVFKVQDVAQSFNDMTSCPPHWTRISASQWKPSAALSQEGATQ